MCVPDARKKSKDLQSQDRRAFLKGVTFAAGGAFLGSSRSDADPVIPPSPAGAPKPEDYIYSVCLQCNTGCGIKVRLENGRAAKIEGSPFSPWTLVPPLPYETSLKEAATIEGALCPKGQAGLQTAYDPYRLRRVLKRAGKRGENKWVTIPFHQAVREIVEGGEIFASVPGEQDRTVAGLRELFALRDPSLAAEMGKAVDDLRKKKTPEEKKAAVEDFQAKFSAHLNSLIDPAHPDLGPKNNQAVFAWGRLKAGRSEFIKRFISESFGSTNAHGHTTVCQGSLYFTGKAMSDQFADGKLTGGQKFYWQADTSNVEFLLAIGSAYIEGGYGPTHHARKLMKNLADGKLKLVVVDPRFSKIASKAHKWIPIRPGTEAALALAMIRWIIDQRRYDAKFLGNANKAAAVQSGEQSWTNAAWLVKEDGSFLRASEIGLAQKEKRTDKSGQEWEFDPFVALRNGAPVAFDPNDENNAVIGDLLVNTTLDGKKIKSALQIIYESASSRSITEWAAICDVPASTIEELAAEFTSHGKRAVADPHRGVSQHTNGFYNVLAVYTLNALIGNWDWKGGIIKASTYNILGEKDGQPYNLGKMHPAKFKPFGLSIIRHDAKYEESTIFSGYPAKRNWYPFSSDIYQEIIPSIGDAYPYPIKALFLYMAAPTYALPGGQTNIEVLLDVNKVPLIIACDITVGETSMYADYIFPDLTYLERWEFHGSHPSIPAKVQPVRNPVIAPITDTVTVFGEQMPLSLEAMILGIAEKLELRGFGRNAFADGMHLLRPDDFYLKMAANLAAGEKPGDAVPEADDEELHIFLNARRHLPATVFDPAKWENAAGKANWRRVVYLLNRGGRFQDSQKAFNGEKFANKYGALVNLYLEKYAKTKSPITGKPYPGCATYLPIQDLLGRPINDEPEGYDLQLITYREVTHTKSRTVADPWLLAISPSNSLLMNPLDAQRLGFSEGDRARVTSKSNPEGVWNLGNNIKKPMVGSIHVTPGIRPGVIAFSLGMGHWAYGSTDIFVDGLRIKGDPKRGRGLHANAAMRLDDYLKNTCLLDPVGGSVSFYDTMVRLVKV